MLRVAGWAAVLVAVALGIDSLLVGPLAAPTLGQPGSWAAWGSARTPLQAFFAVVGRMVVLGAWYLLAATVVGTAARLLDAATLVRATDALTVPVLRRALRGALGVGLATAVVTTGAGARSPIAGPGPAGTRVALVAASAPLPEADEPPAGAAEPPVMRRLPDGEAAPTPPESPGSALAAAPSDWLVAPGDHLWSVAVRVLETAWGRAASDDDVTPYWQRLVEANRDRLADPANPDLVYPGQRLAVVEPPPLREVP